ncbi:MAG: hypothetical protein FVQ83_05425 [Chloroflexi bacterium]|nr:hypothetical protein [Chloroflexota bacterium]
MAQSIACGASSTSEPAVTFTPLPSATSTPTNTPVTPTQTPLPTQTPTTTYTPTPNLTATQAILQTQAVEDLIIEIRSELENYDIASDSGHLGYSSESTTEIRTTDYNGIEIEPFAGSESFSNYVLHVIVTWDTTSGFAGCGIIFR